jgi:hypothetical protein
MHVALSDCREGGVIEEIRGKREQGQGRSVSAENHAVRRVERNDHTSEGANDRHQENAPMKPRYPGALTSSDLAASMESCSPRFQDFSGNAPGAPRSKAPVKDRLQESCCLISGVGDSGLRCGRPQGPPLRRSPAIRIPLFTPPTRRRRFGEPAFERDRARVLRTKGSRKKLSVVSCQLSVRTPGRSRAGFGTEN